MIVVHIGMPKTGSTTIQHFLRTNDTALRDISIDYTTIGRLPPKSSSVHHHLADELLGRKAKPGRKGGSLADLQRNLASNKNDVIMLSSEEFSLCDEDTIGRFKQVLLTSDRKILIIMIIRDLTDLMPSSYAQTVRYGTMVRNFDKFFDQRIKNDVWNNFAIAARWAGVFGWDSVRVRALNKDSLRGGDLIDDFLESAGLDPDAPDVRNLLRPPRVNESPGWRTLEAVRGYFGGRSDLDERHPIRKIIELRARGEGRQGLTERRNFGMIAEEIGVEMGWNTDRGQYMTRVQAELCVDTYNIWIDQLNQHLKAKLPAAIDLETRGFITRSFLPDLTHIDPHELAFFYDTWAGRIVS